MEMSHIYFLNACYRWMIQSFFHVYAFFTLEFVPFCIFFISCNSFYLDIHHNIEEKIYHYLCYIVIFDICLIFKISAESVKTACIFKTAETAN